MQIWTQSQIVVSLWSVYMGFLHANFALKQLSIEKRRVHENDFGFYFVLGGGGGVRYPHPI